MADVYGMSRVLDIAKEYSLPDWWVLSVIIEYFDCRRYGENDEIWTFDFNKPNQQEIKTIPEKKVVIPGYILSQNIHPAGVSARKAIHETWLPVGMKDPNFVPEGLLNPTAFPGIRISIKDADPKLMFSDLFAVVLDGGRFYQWDIRELEDELEPRNILDAPEFSEVAKKLQKYQKSPDAKQLDQIKNDIKVAYKKIEIRREKLRQKVLEYHNKRKKDYDNSLANASESTAKRRFSTITLTEDGYQAQTQMAPVFLYSAVRNLHRAEKAEEAKKSSSFNMKDYYALEELEYSTICIISAASCLEEYISYVVSKHLPVESKIFDRASHKQKWLWVPAALNLPFRFKPDEEPYRSFSCIITLRNNAIHYKAEFDKVENGISRASNQLNVKNSRIAVNVIKDMITKMSEDGTIPLPTWIKNFDAFVAFWDEGRLPQKI